MKDWRIALALLLPLAGLVAGIVRNELNLVATTTWTIPVEGYDPRDPLRGHHVDFRYLWQAEGDVRLCQQGNCLICLEHRAGTVIARIVPRETPVACANRVDPLISNISADFSSRIFVPETDAPELEAALQHAPLEVVALLGRDGRLINQRLQPRMSRPEGAVKATGRR